MTSEQPVWYVCGERCRRKAGKMAHSHKPELVAEGRACVVCKRLLGGQWAIALRAPQDIPTSEVRFEARTRRGKVKCVSESLF